MSLKHVFVVELKFLSRFQKSVAVAQMAVFASDTRGPRFEFNIIINYAENVLILTFEKINIKKKEVGNVLFETFFRT